MWHATTPADHAPRPPLAGDTDADVAIVGAGLTGLWTAYYLIQADPTLRIVVLESETAGFGASGRNGGWCSATFPASLATLAGLDATDDDPAGGRAAALAQHRAMRATVDEVLAVAQTEGIDVEAAKGGTIRLARGAAQLARARAAVDSARSWNRGPDDLRLLDRGQAEAIVRATRTSGATYSPDCAALHPLRLVHGLAETVVGRGVRLHERTPVTAIEPGRARTCHGDVRADVVVRATEGYTAALPGLRRSSIPVYSLVIATEPLSPTVWDEIGLAHRETFSDLRHLIVYGQRTADDRLVFGGRGAPYHLGSQVRPQWDRDDGVFARLLASLVEMFPAVRGAHVTHAWGGPVGITRDWCASVGLDRSSGLAWAGGYVGQGVATTNLAGRTLRDLVLGHDTELVRLPWTGHRSPTWEPEPARWLGVNAGRWAMTLADVEEQVSHRPSLVARAVAPLLG